MKKYGFIIIFTVTSLMAARSQEYKVRRSSGKMIINSSAVLIEGHSGNEIIFSSRHTTVETDPRAKGLQTINSSGYRDNTGLGISVVEKGTTIEVNQVTEGLDIKILVPKGLILSFVNHKAPDTGTVICRNLENEIEIETDYNPVLLENITGPVTVRTLYGSVDAVFKAPVKGPVSIVSIQSTVDVAIPVDTKAELKLKSTYRTIMTSPDFKIEVNKEVKKSEEEEIPRYVSWVNGKLNGGGPEFRLASEFGKIYLRKAQ